MDVREKMYEWRMKTGTTLRVISIMTGISETLLGMVETGEVTHPKIVEKIKKAYKLTDLEAEQLMPKIHRPHDPEYEPDKFKRPPELFKEKLLPKKEEIFEYISERQDTHVRRHEKRGEY